MSLDSTMSNVLPEGTGSSSPQASNSYSSTSENPVKDKVDPNSGDGGQRHANVTNASLNKPADNGIISPKFYESVDGSPGSLESTMNSVLELNFNR